MGGGGVAYIYTRIYIYVYVYIYIYMLFFWGGGCFRVYRVKGQGFRVYRVGFQGKGLVFREQGFRSCLLGSIISRAFYRQRLLAVTSSSKSLGCSDEGRCLRKPSNL